MSSPEAARLTLGLWRIAILSALSARLYYVYWFYRTWKQFPQESKGQERFYPVWQALTQLVPVYGQFRLHRHTALIREIAMTSIPELRLSPWAVVALFVAAAVTGVASSGGVAPLVVLALLAANTALVTVTMAWPQSAPLLEGESWAGRPSGGSGRGRGDRGRGGAVAALDPAAADDLGGGHRAVGLVSTALVTGITYSATKQRRFSSCRIVGPLVRYL